MQPQNIFSSWKAKLFYSKPFPTCSWKLLSTYQLLTKRYSKVALKTVACGKRVNSMKICNAKVTSRSPPTYVTLAPNYLVQRPDVQSVTFSIMARHFYAAFLCSNHFFMRRTIHPWVEFYSFPFLQRRLHYQRWYLFVKKINFYQFKMWLLSDVRMETVQSNAWFHGYQRG
jgi:hypothetical protein